MARVVSIGKHFSNRLYLSVHKMTTTVSVWGVAFNTQICWTPLRSTCFTRHVCTLPRTGPCVLKRVTESVHAAWQTCWCFSPYYFFTAWFASMWHSYSAYPACGLVVYFFSTVLSRVKTRSHISAPVQRCAHSFTCIPNFPLHSNSKNYFAFNRPTRKNKL